MSPAPGVIAFVEAKRPGYDRIRQLLAPSEATGVWSNFGPASLRLEEAVAQALEVPWHRRVVACASGTMALHGLVWLHEHLAGRTLRWVVSAFTFHAQLQGPLARAQVLDCDDEGFLDLEALRRLPVSSYDGIVVTNLFGTAPQAELYEAFAAETGKVLLFDSATCFGSSRAGKRFGSLGAAEMFSFHHTKPFGFGEGGCVVLPAELEDTFRSLINFGLYKAIDTGSRSFNGKLSDVAAGFILDRLAQGEEIRAAHSEQFRRIAGIARSLGLDILTRGEQDGTVANLVPVLSRRAVEMDAFADAPLVVRKYYRPIAPRLRAEMLYARVACLPCHGGVAAATDAELRRLLATLAD